MSPGESRPPSKAPNASVSAADRVVRSITDQKSPSWVAPTATASSSTGLQPVVGTHERQAAARLLPEESRQSREVVLQRLQHRRGVERCGGMVEREEHDRRAAERDLVLLAVNAT